MFVFASRGYWSPSFLTVILLNNCGIILTLKQGLVRGRSLLFKSALGPVAYANHIGGALFGLVYGAYGKQLVDEARPSFLSHYIGLKHRIMEGVDERNG